MDPSKLSKLRQVEIAKPCLEDWDAMEGDEQKRFCAGCGCFVHNLAEFDANDAEQLLSQSGRTCTRITHDPKKGILTKSGWIPRLALAGAMAAAAGGCSMMGSTAPNDPTPPTKTPAPGKKVALSTVPSVVASATPYISQGATPLEDWYEKKSKPVMTMGVKILNKGLAKKAKKRSKA